MRGDILLFKSDGSLPAWFVSHFTHGPYVHVAIDVGQGKEIAAHPKGVSKGEIYKNKGKMTRVPVLSKADPHSVSSAFDWLESQVGKPYGWVDILNAIVGIFGLPLYFLQRNHRDCSALASEFINRLDIPDLYIESPDLVSPNDLARILHLL